MNNSAITNKFWLRNEINKITLRRAIGGDCWFIVVERNRETIVVVTDTRTLKSSRRFNIATADQATAVFRHPEWKMIKARAEGFAS